MTDDPLTPAGLKAARHKLGLSVHQLAKLVRVESERTVRRWEAGERDIPGPVQVIVDALMRSAAVRRFFGVTVKGEGEAARAADDREPD